MTHRWATKRHAEVLRLRRAGATWAAIGAVVGVSRERARQIGAQAEVLERRAASSPADWGAQEAARLAAARARRAATEGAWRDRVALRQRAADKQWLSQLEGDIGRVSPDYRSLRSLGHTIFGRYDDHPLPLRAEAIAIFDAWFDGRANETATVQRLRRLLETRKMPEGLAA